MRKLIEKKIKSGETEAIELEEVAEEEPEDVRTINFMDVLKKSVASATRNTKKRAPAKRKAASKKVPSRKKSAKRRKTG